MTDSSLGEGGGRVPLPPPPDTVVVGEPSPEEADVFMDDEEGEDDQGAGQG